MDTRIASPVLVPVERPRRPSAPLFRSTLRASSVTEDVVGAVLLLLMAAPLVLFSLVLPALSAPAACVEAPAAQVERVSALIR
jgi:hypothetical protein